jgi:hypothetical protein
METAMPFASINRRHILASAGLMLIPNLANAQTVPTPIAVYNDVLGLGWYDQSWAFIEMSVYAGPVKAIRVRGGPKSALALEHPPFSTSGYTKLSFFINGGANGGQSIAVMALIGGKPVEAHYIVRPEAGKWLFIEIPLADIGAANTTIDGLWFQGIETYEAYMIAKIMIE